MWVNNFSALFIRCVAFAALLLLVSTRIYAAEEGTVYQANLTALTDDPVFQEYLRNLKREAANASAQSVNKPAPRSQPSLHQPRVIEVSDDTEESSAPFNTTGRFIFTSAAAKPLAEPTRVNASSATAAAIIQNAAIRTSQIEQLRQRASGSNAQ